MEDATVSARVEYDAPFSLSVPDEPKTMDMLTTEELNVLLQQGYEQSLAGEGRPFDEVFDEFERNLERGIEDDTD